jgi:hypothetical protein
MKMTARIKQRTSPLAKRVRRLASGRPMIVIDPMGDADAVFVKRLMAAARKAGRSLDFYRVSAM